jgi:hypothetical protein
MLRQSWKLYATMYAVSKALLQRNLSRAMDGALLNLNCVSERDACHYLPIFIGYLKVATETKR